MSGSRAGRRRELAVGVSWRGGRPPEWRPEVELDEALVRRLLAEQFPGLPVGALRPFAEGWDNVLWLVDEVLAFRFPRRAIAVPGVEREIRVLPALAGRLPLPVPAPEYVGRPSEAFRWPFFGAPLLRGAEPARVTMPEPRTALGRGLGRFLRSLHDGAVLAEHGAELPYDPMGRANMAARVPRTREQLAALQAAGLWSTPPSAERILADAATLDRPDGLALVHGDLHVRHVLVADGAPSAVIDWGDVCIGDPAIDLSLYWSLLDGGGRLAFRDAYGGGGLDHGRLLRARLLALFLNALLARYADDTGDEALFRETIAGLERTLVDD
jgi:aminoglycoside phosphotransferase (APT) family kinase protein